MKKGITIAVLVIMALPSLTFASWYNPVSWWGFFFHREPQVVEKIIYVQATTTPQVAGSSTETVIKTVAPTPTVKTAPVIDDQVKIKTQVKPTATGVNYKSALLDKLNTELAQWQSLRDNNVEPVMSHIADRTDDFQRKIKIASDTSTNGNLVDALANYYNSIITYNSGKYDGLKKNELYINSTISQIQQQIANINNSAFVTIDTYNTAVTSIQNNNTSFNQVNTNITTITQQYYIDEKKIDKDIADLSTEANILYQKNQTIQQVPIKTNSTCFYSPYAGGGMMNCY